MRWYLNGLKQYAVFKGRAARKEYWMFILVNAAIIVALAIIDAIVGSRGVIFGAFGFVTLLPTVAISVRRLHDTGRSGWWLLISLIPFVGVVVLLIVMAQGSQPGEGPYGLSPVTVAGTLSTAIPHAVISWLPPQHREKIDLLAAQISELVISESKVAEDELEAYNTSRRTVWGAAAAVIPIVRGSASDVLRVVVSCIEADFLVRNANDVRVEAISEVEVTDLTQSQLDSLSPGLRAKYERKIAKHSRGSEGEAQALPGIRKLVVTSYFPGSFGKHEILRVGADSYVAMPCSVDTMPLPYPGVHPQPGAASGPPVGDVSVFSLDTFITTRQAPAPRSTTLTACISNVAGELVASAPMVFNVLSDEGRRQIQSGIDLLTPNGEKLLNIKVRSAFALQTHAWDIAAPGESTLGSFEHRSLFLFRDKWPFRDSAGNPVGVVEETVDWRMFLRIVPFVGAFFGDQEYIIRVGDRAIAKIQQVGIGLHTAVSPGISGPDERRMVIAFSVLRTLHTG